MAALALVAESSPARPDLIAVTSAPSTTVVSKRYGYRMVLAGPYYVTLARAAWTGGFPFGDNGEVDVIVDARDRKFIVAAKRVPAGTRLRKWEASIVAVKQAGPCQKSRAFRTTKLGGVTARELKNVCFVYDVITVVALHGGRGYLFEFLSPNANPAAPDRRLFEAGRRAFRFTSK